MGPEKPDLIAVRFFCPGKSAGYEISPVTAVIHQHSFHGVIARSGDILFTRDGVPGSLFGEIWRVLGQAMQSEFNHCAMYLGPGVRFVESAANGVVVVEMQDDGWDAAPYAQERLLVDELIGIGDPVAGRGYSSNAEREVRERAIAFCLDQVREHKPYNLDFFNPETDGAFYCSQLIYKAYAAQEIRLHAHRGADSESVLAPIVFPREVWDACREKRQVKAE